MRSPRRYRRGWLLLVPALAASANAAGMLMVVDAMQPERPPRLRVTVESEPEAGDVVMISDASGRAPVHCGPDGTNCRVELRPGQRLRLDAMPGRASVLERWTGCEPDPTDVRRCEIVASGHSVDVTVTFGRRPDGVNVAMLDTPAPDEIALPELQPPPRDKKTPEEIEAEKLEEPIELAVVPPPPPEVLPPPLPPPPPPPPPEEKKAEEIPPVPNMRMVEVPDENEVTEAPDDATHLSDKNRDVAEETRAQDTNLEKETKGEAVASRPSDDTTSEEIGGPDDHIRQLEDSDPTTTERVEASDRSGASEVASGVVAGEEGEGGEEGTGERAEPGVLSMRGIGGRGSITERSGDGNKKGKRGKEGVKTQLEFDDYERIVGKERADKERELARREQSTKKGRYSKKLAAVKSALENFTPDVRTGNQTALKTRAHPFAVYVARMHRRIHELWGFGFLESLDGKSSSHPLNDFELFVSLEMSINPDGTVHKVTVAKTSGKLEFDVAAIDTVMSAEPYEQTPEKIRSVDQRVYLRWGFYRNWRQCGTFNVEPYILTDIPGGIEPLAEGMDASDGDAKARRGDAPVTPEPPRGSGAAGDDHHGHVHAEPGKVSREATYAANMWIAGYTSGSLERMLKVSAVPFYGGAEVAAKSTKELRAVYEALVGESGSLRDWELMSAAEYIKRSGKPMKAPDDTMVVLVRAQETFAVVLVPTTSGEYRANAVVR